MPIELLPVEGKTQISIPSAIGKILEPLESIVRFEADSNYSKIHFAHRTPIFVARTLGSFERMLSNRPFFRVHHGHLIHLPHLVSVDKIENQVHLSDGMTIPISRRRKDGFLKAIEKLNRLS